MTYLQVLSLAVLLLIGSFWLVFLLLLGVMRGKENSTMREKESTKPTSKSTSINDTKGEGMIKVKKNKRGEFYAVLIGKNGKMIWKTSESYKRRRAVDRAIEILLEAK